MKNLQWRRGQRHRDPCAEVLASARRIRWEHDESLDAGTCGDATWVAMIIDSIRQGGPFDDEGDIHLVKSFQTMTNQPIDNACRACWIAWWDSHRACSEG